MALWTACAHAPSFETTASSGLLRMRLISIGAAETTAAHSVLILRSPPKAGVSKDGRREGAVRYRRARHAPSPVFGVS
ncbi:hypothetical protein XH79_04715 [Bradyrhizobium sp. CCBAU 45389]|nr:hypothetical protein [Bradyrhizobium sp. CCBAU 45389]